MFHGNKTPPEFVPVLELVIIGVGVIVGIADGEA